MKICRKSWLLLAVGCALMPALLSAADRSARLKSGEFNPDDETVQLFAAMEADQLDVKFIPKDDTVGRLIIKNKTNRPLNIQLPDAFAVMPILAQPGLGGGAGGGQAGGGGGGGLGGGGLGGGGGGQGGGFFNVKAEKVGDLKVPIVCLEHGKPEPRPAIPYEIRPLADFSQDPVLFQLMKMFGSGQINRRVVQAAAWHLTDDMSWEELNSKVIKHLNGTVERYFSVQELQVAYQLTQVAKQQAEQEETKSPGEQTSQFPE